MTSPAEEFYYCPDCKKFHEVRNDKSVSRKLCFSCGNRKASKTKIVTNSFGEKTQWCQECFSNNKYLL